MSAFKWLSIWAAIKEFIKGILANYLEYRRRKKLRREKEKEVEDTYEQAKKEGDPNKLLDAFNKAKDTKIE